MKNNFKIKIIPSFLIVCSLLVVAMRVDAASLYMSSSYSTVGVGEVVAVDIKLNSPEGVNAVEGMVSWSRNDFDLVDACECGSVINFWIEKMTINKIGDGVAFSGVIPGGFSNTAGQLFTLKLKAKKAGSSRLTFSNTRALLNDGKGTVATLSTAPLTITISSQKTPRPTEEVKDNIPPESFTPVVSRDTSIFENQWFVVFDTQDKQTGIERYEILETSDKRQVTSDKAEWAVAASPYLLKDQTLKSYIYIKAIDKNGNVRMATIKPHANYMVWMLFGVLAIIIFLMSWLRRRR